MSDHLKNSFFTGGKRLKAKTANTYAAHPVLIY